MLETIAWKSNTYLGMIYICNNYFTQQDLVEKVFNSDNTQ